MTRRPRDVDVDRFRAGKRLWSRQDDEQLRARYPHEPTAPVARDLRRSLTAVYARARLLGLSKTADYLASPAACQLRRGDHVGARFRFQPGHVPANKGLRRPGWSVGRMRETQFKRGQRHGKAAELYMPIGSTRIADGYLLRKVSDVMNVPYTVNWKPEHRLLWERAHGPVPPGHALIFRNGDRTDIRLANLACLSRRELMKQNSVHNLPPDLAKTIQLLGRSTDDSDAQGPNAMPRNKIQDLRDHLFETLERLKDDENPMDLDRARAVAEVSKVIVESAKVEVAFVKATGAMRSTDFLPDGDLEPNRPRLPAAVPIKRARG